MKFSKITAAAVCIALSASLFAQTQRRAEASVESQYLNDADGIIIMSLASSDEYDNKLVALQYLQFAVESGNASEQIINAIDQLAGEGLTTQTREKGRITNNYPDIRREACLMMSKVAGDEKTMKHIKNTLVSIATEDKEPMVMAAAIKSLGDIGINNNDEVVDAIAFANRRNQALNPTSSLAFEVLNALEKLESSTENKRMIIDTCAAIASDYHYVTPVRNRALGIIKAMSSSGNLN